MAPGAFAFAALRPPTVMLLMLLLVQMGAEAALGGGTSFAQCLASHPPGVGTLGSCAGTDLLHRLQSFDDSPEFDVVDGLSLARDETMPRETFTLLDRDPTNFRSIVESISSVVSRRQLRWDMSTIYPGLMLHVSPTYNQGGVLEFTMDPLYVNKHAVKEVSTGRILARQFLLPFLLGFKFNIATLVPILFSLIALLAKKAVFLSKAALVMSSAFGLGSLLFGAASSGYYPGPGQYSQFHNTHYRDTTSGPEQDYAETVYGHHGSYGDDPVRLYGDLQLQQVYKPRDDGSKGRNFAWSEADKGKKN